MPRRGRHGLCTLSRCLHHLLSPFPPKLQERFSRPLSHCVPLLLLPCHWLLLNCHRGGILARTLRGRAAVHSGRGRGALCWCAALLRRRKRGAGGDGGGRRRGSSSRRGGGGGVPRGGEGRLGGKGGPAGGGGGEGMGAAAPGRRQGTEGARAVRVGAVGEPGGRSGPAVSRVFCLGPAVAVLVGGCPRSNIRQRTPCPRRALLAGAVDRPV